MRIAATRIALALLLACTIYGWQLPARAGGVEFCPGITVSCPDSAGGEGHLTFTAEVRGGGSDKKPTYAWTVSAGNIVSGQGTNSIEVGTVGVGGRSVTAIVEVGGYDRACANKASCSTAAISDPTSRKFGEYGGTSDETEKDWLDTFAVDLFKEPSALGYIIAYGGRRTHLHEAINRATRAKRFLVEYRGMPAERLVAMDGGYRERLAVELYIVPQGMIPPSPSPTVDLSEVKIIKRSKLKTHRRSRQRAFTKR